MGSYAITQGTLTNGENPNYDITLDARTLTINQANVTLAVTVDPASQKVGKAATITVTAQNAAGNLMASGWEEPSGTVTVTVGDESITMALSGGNTWSGAYIIPNDAQLGGRRLLRQ